MAPQAVDWSAYREIRHWRWLLLKAAKFHNHFSSSFMIIRGHVRSVIRKNVKTFSSKSPTLYLISQRTKWLIPSTSFSHSIAHAGIIRCKRSNWTCFETESNFLRQSGGGGSYGHELSLPSWTWRVSIVQRGESTLSPDSDYHYKILLKKEGLLKNKKFFYRKNHPTPHYFSLKNCHKDAFMRVNYGSFYSNIRKIIVCFNA